MIPLPSEAFERESTTRFGVRIVRRCCHAAERLRKLHRHCTSPDASFELDSNPL
jgi:hypothetical protein